MKVLFLELAEQEFYDSQEYYEEHQTNLGNKFTSEVYNALKRIQKFPSMFIKVKKDIRKCIINKFPFNILYSIEGDIILVIAIAHHHRNPDYWIDRIN
ncbi:type II toxin-antitoxin system RelE/ParE family toxin [Aliarcobacter cryaerophilus]|uniref:Plasmid stabilization protein n=2 Tax=Aliarcobacter cryaerophilus TaxID=28198 RepID=A0A2S9TKX7_9BACT|nr:type II toxin-antitoxin system RelE/ParE family toxin [Aliarcobacter cryaerophilus]PRM99505.1 plasmid stabilization protein [Arcobacter cryaerophilus gv. crypticus]